MFNLANNLEEEESIKKIEDLKREAKENAKSRTRVRIRPNRFEFLIKNKSLV